MNASSTAAALVNASGPVVLGHRGASRLRPENTVEAFDLAVRQGVDGIELDVRVTADGVPVIAHDPSTGRMGDRDMNIATTSWSDLQQVDAGYRYSSDQGASFPWRERGVRIPTLSSVLDRLEHVPLLLELKSSVGRDMVRRVLDHYQAHRGVVVASAEHRAMKPFMDGRYLRSASRREIAAWYVASYWSINLGERGYDLLSIPERKGPLRLVTNRSMAAAFKAGVPVFVWTIDDTSVARRLWRSGVSGIITNDPEAMIRTRAELVSS